MIIIIGYKNIIDFTSSLIRCDYTLTVLLSFSKVGRRFPDGSASRHLANVLFYAWYLLSTLLCHVCVALSYYFSIF